MIGGFFFQHEKMYRAVKPDAGAKGRGWAECGDVIVVRRKSFREMQNRKIHLRPSTSSLTTSFPSYRWARAMLLSTFSLFFLFELLQNSGEQLKSRWKLSDDCGHGALKLMWWQFISLRRFGDSLLCSVLHGVWLIIESNPKNKRNAMKNVIVYCLLCEVDWV